MKNKFFDLSKRVMKSELMRGASYVFAGTLLASFFSFLINFFFVRTLSKIDYGTYASLISLITLFIIPATSLSPVIVKFTSKYFAKGENDKLKTFYQKMTKFSIIIFFIIFVSFLIISPFLNKFLKLDNFLYIPIVGLITAMAYMNIINNGVLQGLLKFSKYSLNQLLGSLIRFILGIIFVFLGFRVVGAILPSFFLFFSIYLLSSVQLRFLFVDVNKITVKIQSKELIKYAIPTTIALLSLSSFISIDVILVKHFFDANDAGLYSGLSLIGKVIFYFTGIIPSVMFPLIVKRSTRKEKITNLFYLSIFLVTLPSVVITSFYYLLPNFSVKFFLGANYLSVMPYLGFFGIYITVFSVVNVCVNFFLSIGKTNIFVPIIIAAVSQITAISLFHSSFYQIIGVSLIVLSLLMFYLLFIFAKDYMNLPINRKYLFFNKPSF